MHLGTYRVERILINDAISLDFRARIFPSICSYQTHFQTASPSILHCKLENKKNKKSVKFQGEMLNLFEFCDFIQVFVFTTKHTLEFGRQNE